MVNYYTVENCRPSLDDVKTSAKKYKRRLKEYVWNIPAAFDIETTSFMIGAQKAATMYIWMCDIADVIIIGRTWSEWLGLMEIIRDVFATKSGDTHIIIYVHNLSYEFQFMRKWVEWEKVFAAEDRKVLQAITTSGIEFRCSYLLSGYSLEHIGKNLRTHKVEKMVGDLDYRLTRHSYTPPTARELGYCINDVRVLVAYISECIERDGDIRHIQLTKTGYVRKFTRDNCFRGRYSTGKYQNFIQHLRLDIEGYKQATRAFHGGYTHASAYYSGHVLRNVDSFDIASSYPAVMCAEKRFPVSSPRHIGDVSIAEVESYSRRFACVFDVTFYGLESSRDFEHPLSASKGWNKSGVIEDNGRVVCADTISLSCTEVDYYIYKDFYKWEDIEIHNLRVFTRGYLPRPIIASVLKLFVDKTELKDVEGKETEYMQAKEYINSEYGQCVTAVCRDEIIYDEDWTEAPGDWVKQIERYNDSKKRVLYYYWGVYITSLAMRNLFALITEAGEDYVYSDTDSVKMLNGDKHRAYIDRYNDNMRRKLLRMCDFYNFDRSLITPKTQKGKVKTLGVYEYEGRYQRFKTLGAKRYMIEKPDALRVDGKSYDISITVSGVNKSKAVPWLKEEYGNNDDIFNAFSEGLYFPPEATGKLVHTYIDFPLDGVITDYRGETAHFSELSCIHLTPTGYDMSLSQRYIDYLRGLREKTN